MSEELKSILKMVEEGKITSEEGERLIKSINADERTEVKPVNGHDQKFLRIEVLSFDDDEAKVKVNVPLGIAKSFLKMGFIKNQINEHTDEDVNIDIEEISKLIDMDYTGEIVSVDSKDAKVKVWIE